MSDSDGDHEGPSEPATPKSTDSSSARRELANMRESESLPQNVECGDLHESSEEEPRAVHELHACVSEDEDDSSYRPAEGSQENGNEDGGESETLPPVLTPVQTPSPRTPSGQVPCPPDCPPHIWQWLIGYSDVTLTWEEYQIASEVSLRYSLNFVELSPESPSTKVRRITRTVGQHHEPHRPNIPEAEPRHDLDDIVLNAD